MENIIEITNVRKIYRTYQKKSGLKNMIKNIIYPDFKDFIAVDDMSFVYVKVILLAILDQMVPEKVPQ